MSSLLTVCYQGMDSGCIIPRATHIHTTRRIRIKHTVCCLYCCCFFLWTVDASYHVLHTYTKHAVQPYKAYGVLFVLLMFFLLWTMDASYHVLHTYCVCMCTYFRIVDFFLSKRIFVQNVYLCINVRLQCQCRFDICVCVKTYICSTYICVPKRRFVHEIYVCGVQLSLT